MRRLDLRVPAALHAHDRVSKSGGYHAKTSGSLAPRVFLVERKTVRITAFPQGAATGPSLNIIRTRLGRVVRPANPLPVAARPEQLEVTMVRHNVIHSRTSNQPPLGTAEPAQTTLRTAPERLACPTPGLGAVQVLETGGRAAGAHQ
jgi:hypothetical protein